MADAAQRAWRERLVALVALAFGGVTDVGEFLESGRVDGVAQKTPAITPDVARYMKAIEIAGRFIMPDEVEGFLNGTKSPKNAPPHN